jgi:acetolactate decarboxylase
MKHASIVALFLSGCSTPAWNGSVAQWGTLREVLRDGDTHGRVRLDAIDGVGLIGIGALEDLKGEITIVDGRVWVSRPDEQNVSVTRSVPGAGDRAAFLAVAAVRTWSVHATDGPLDLSGLETRLSRLAAGRETIPFIVEGELESLDAHVLNGACPFAADPARRGEPVRFHRERVRGTVAGFYTTLPAGTLTHHGSRIHAHVILPDGPLTGHIDRIVVDGTIRIASGP